MRRKEPTVQISFMDNFALLEPIQDRLLEKSIDAGGGEALNGNLKIISWKGCFAKALKGWSGKYKRPFLMPVINFITHAELYVLYFKLKL